MKLFQEYEMKGLRIKNRVVMPPMCMYKATSNGIANEFHYTHYSTRAIGGVGLIIFESTAVSPEGRITGNDLGIWDDEHIHGLKKIVDACKAYGAKTALQINHAGRKSTVETCDILAPNAIRFSEDYRVPTELTVEQIKKLVLDFKKAAQRANEAGFDALEIHGAHGYLIHQFLSPLTNTRTDQYGGSLKNRIRFLKEVLEVVKAVWPDEKPVLLRVSASDYEQDGIDASQMVQIIHEIRDYIDIAHVSSGGLLPSKVNAYPGYQVPFSEKIRNECSIPTIAVGLIKEADLAEEILSNQRADLVALGRELLRNPYWVFNTAAKNNDDGYIPSSYKNAF
ncbi:MAG: dehydrogenase NamA [Eubacterium sp.]|jgi:NADPH2 dehydrogenase|nr:dehydrogenase NamA [Clostridia bacterium]MDF2989374.1 dehydrogenase NamA [Eubacterium sp.]